MKQRFFGQKKYDKIGSRIRYGCTAVLIVAATFGILSARLDAYPRYYLNKPEVWFQSEEANRILDNVLSWQSLGGGWPRNTNTTVKPFQGNRNTIRGTFDNSATTDELRLLAKAFCATGKEEYKKAFLTGLDHILQAQYPNGGWPQYDPPGEGYNRYITFNDNAVVRLLRFVREVATSQDYSFLDTKRRTQAQRAFDRGIECILKCQIPVDGKLTVWCAQHDEKDYRPRPARRFEPVSLSGGESASILGLLMSIENPTPEITRAVHAGAQWYDSVKLTGIRWARVNQDRKVVPDASAPLLWARFYEIGTNRPIFAGRDGVKKYDVAQIDTERRTGYAWYGSWGNGVAERYEKWKKEQAAKIRNDGKIRMVIIGDSTVCDYPNTHSCRGWGQFIGEHFSKRLEILNHARSGRSTKTFIQQGLWEKSLKTKPELVLIQFGHNDSHSVSKPESTKASGDYMDYLRRYITDCRAIKATPILVTPMHRRTFYSDGKLKDNLKPYADAMKAVGRELNVPVVDLHTHSGELFARLGDAGSMKLANSPNDRTHFNEKGARTMAELVAEELALVGPEMLTREMLTSRPNQDR